MYQEYEDEIENVTEAELLANVYGNDDVDDHILYRTCFVSCHRV
jgi:hypothetical protein